MAHGFEAVESITPRPARNDLGGPGWGGLIDSVVDVLDAVSSTRPPDDVVVEATRLLTTVKEMLVDYAVDEAEAPANQRSDLPRRGHPAYFPTEIEHMDDRALRGRVSFARFQHGHNTAVHGGMIGLFFDDMFGAFVASRDGGERVRTVSMAIDYRSITPIQRPLSFEAEIGQREGRKIRVRGALRDGDRVCAEVSILMIVLNPDQP